MSEITIQDLEGWVEKMMIAQNVTDFKLKVTENSEKGDGFLGEVSFVTVHTSDNGTKRTYDLVVKSAKKSDELRKLTPIKDVYKREIFFYSKILPIFDEFQKMKKVEKIFSKYPKCFSVCSEDHKEVVILQNMKSVGFDIHNKRQPMNLNHIHMVFINYAKFHALSLALKDQKPALFQNITKNMTDVLADFIEKGKMFNNFAVNFKHNVGLLEKGGHQEAAKKFAGMENDIETILSKLANDSANPSVILHGDCWNNNFMFKYDDNDPKRPTDMIFIDFQLSRMASPVFDLSYFLYTCCDKNILENFDFLLHSYHSTLCEALKSLGSDSGKIFSFQRLREHWRYYGRFGLIMGSLVLKMCLCYPDEAPDIGDVADSGAGFESSLDVENIKEQAQYDDRMKACYLHFADNFL